jgi:hypothetical protein
METSTIVTIGVIIGFCLIVFNLGSSLFFLISGRGGSKATVNRLTIRLGIAVIFLICLLLSIYFGFIIPNPYTL